MTNSCVRAGFVAGCLGCSLKTTSDSLRDDVFRCVPEPPNYVSQGAQSSAAGFLAQVLGMDLRARVRLSLESRQCQGTCECSNQATRRTACSRFTTRVSRSPVHLASLASPCSRSGKRRRRGETSFGRAIYFGIASRFSLGFFPGFCLIWLLSFLAFGLCLLGVLAFLHFCFFCFLVCLLSFLFLLFAFWLFGSCRFWLWLSAASASPATPQHHRLLAFGTFVWWLLPSHVSVDGGGAAPPQPPPLLRRQQIPMNPTPTVLNSRFGPKSPKPTLNHHETHPKPPLKLEATLKANPKETLKKTLNQHNSLQKTLNKPTLNQHETIPQL